MSYINLSNYVVEKPQRDYDFWHKPKNNLLNQIESDKKPFPIILGELKRDLQEKAFEINASMHGIGKIIFAIYLEREKLIKAEPNMDKRLLLSLHLITVEEVHNFIVEYKKQNTKPAKYNLELIRLALVELLARRKMCLQKNYERRLQKFEKSPQLHFNFYG